LFGWFLDDVIEKSKYPGVVSWDSVANYCCSEDSWIWQAWQWMADNGLAGYQNENERRQIILRFIGLAEFQHTFLTLYSYNEYEWQLDEVLAELALTQVELQQEALKSVYPAILKCFGGIENLAESIYHASSPTICYLADNLDPEAENLCPDEYTIVSENLEFDDQPTESEMGYMEALRRITIWLEREFASQNHHYSQ
jgi:hypothetical protein